jgi:hypothetical protein
MSKERRERKAGIDKQVEKYRKNLGGLSKPRQEFVELFRPAVRKGIESATKLDKALESLDSYDEKRESLEYAELAFSMEKIIEAYNDIFKEDLL